LEKCLYTYVKLNQNSPADDCTATLEHIVPYALGGSASFGIRYCSKKANNDYGRDIDAPFIALPMIGFKRHDLGLKSYSGTVPDMVFKGECTDLQTKCDIIFPYGGEVYADYGIQVAGSIDSGQLAFSGGEDRLRMAVSSLIKKASHIGLNILNEYLQPITNFEDALATATKRSGEILHFRLDFGHEAFFLPWSRGLIKMALGLGAYALGQSWAFSAEADILRSCLISSKTDLASKSLRGTTTARIPPNTAQIIDIRPGRHTLAVLPHHNGMAAYISLFGGEIFDAIIDLGNGPADVKRVNDQLPTTWDCVFHIDPVTRQLTTMCLADVNSRMEEMST
jgi:hypothetical protein